MPRKVLSISDALGNPERREIILYLMENPGISIKKLAKDLNISPGKISSHLLILSRVGLVSIQRYNGKLMLFLNEKLLTEE